MKDDKILILDIETTGFLPNGKIVEVGIVSLDIVTGEKDILYDKVFCPSFITREQLDESWIVQNGYMTTDEILEGADIVNHLIEMQDIILLYPNGATAYNNKFDFDFLESVGLKFPKKLPCPMKVSTDICCIPGKYGKNKWPKVQEAWDFYFGKTDYTELHRGADDAFHEADIVFELIKRGKFKI